MLATRTPSSIWLEVGPDHVCFGHRAYSLADPSRLPAGKTGEVDAEGLCRDDERLWVVGSHSLTRKKVGLPPPANALAHMAKLREPQPNSYLLGFLNLTAKSADPAKPFGHKAAAALPLSTTGGNALTETFIDDPHIAPFLTLPAKENGLDIEGLAVRGNSVFLGLRGPVLSGLALILELKVAVDGEALHLEHFGDGGSPM